MPVRRSKRLFAVACVAACAQLGGCAVVRVVNTDGSESVAIQPMLTDLPRTDADAPRLISLTSVGISNTPLGFNVGVQNAEVIAAPTGCHAIFVVRSIGQAEAASILGKAAQSRCIVTSNEN